MRIFIKTRRIFFALIVLGCGLILALPQTVSAQCGRSATVPLVADLPLLQDDLVYDSLAPAIERSVHYLRQLPRGKAFVLCGERYPVSWLIESLLTFQQIIEQKPSAAALTDMVNRQFNLCQAKGRSSDQRIFVTGYFEPLLKASLTRTAIYRYPLYQKPLDLVSTPGGQGREQKTGRMENGNLVPYSTRAEIEKGQLLVGQELAFLADPVEAFILHIQGSGQIELADGTLRRVQFAAKNGHQYRSIGKLLVEQGVIPLEEATMPRIARYLKEHPEEQDAILHHNDSFIFFRWGDAAAVGPLGCLSEPLTPGRSVALDQDCFPSASLAFLTSQKPIVDENGEIIAWEPFGRFVVNQDCGSAITGAGRLDLFWGAGRYAEIAAGNMKHPGNLYFLIKKK